MNDVFSIKKEAESLEQKIRELEAQLQAKRKELNIAEKEAFRKAVEDFLVEFNIKTTRDLSRVADILRGNTPVVTESVQAEPVARTSFDEQSFEIPTVGGRVKTEAPAVASMEATFPAESDDSVTSDDDQNARSDIASDFGTATGADGENADSVAVEPVREDSESDETASGNSGDSAEESDDEGFEGAEPAVESRSEEAVEDDTVEENDDVEGVDTKNDENSESDGDDDFDWKAFDKLW